ncbi:MAG: hypothetical protein JWM37_292 [Candidatus Saccharibacteria bacterium]|nr:hypothetical protein [Candidatus Saccharibacteria bacterium]
MMDDLSLDRQVANEVLFRDRNSSVKNSLKDMLAPDVPIYFACECTRLDCEERIALTTEAFEALHRDRQQFVIKPGHETLAVENVVDTTPDYYVVRKSRPVPEAGEPE